jgi:hypothetical protein
MSLVNSNVNLLFNILSSFVILFCLFFLAFIGIENYVLRMFVLLVVAWAGFFIYPIFFHSKFSSIIFVRFMKDVPLIFPTFVLTLLLQPLLFGPFIISDGGGVAFSEFNESFFSILFFLIVIFASNCHRITFYLLKKDFFYNFVKFLDKGKGDIDRLLDQTKATNEFELKQVTYGLLSIQIFPVFLLCIVPLFIFQEIIPILFLQHFFGGIIFFSGALMGIGILRTFVLSFEKKIKKKFKVKM